MGCQGEGAGTAEEAQDRWWRGWFERDFSWEGLASKKIEAYSYKKINQFGSHKLGPHKVETLQDYWRLPNDGNSERLRSDKDLRERGELVEGPDGRPYHIAHLPPRNKNGDRVGWKANWTDEEWEHLERLLTARMDTAFAEAGGLTPSGEGSEQFTHIDHETRALLVGAVIGETPSPTRAPGTERPVVWHVTFSNVCFLRTASFQGAQFSAGPAHFRRALFLGSGANFKETKFSGGDADFEKAEFLGGEASFQGAEFSRGIAYFRKTVFSGAGADFQSAKFSGVRVSFDGAVFSGGPASFDETKFHTDTTDFRNAEFLAEASFVRTDFAGKKTSFEGASFSGGSVYFRRAVFSRGSANFENVHFSRGRVSFEDVKFSGGTANFRFAKFFGRDADLKKVEFSGGDALFQGAQFSGGIVYFRDAVLSGGVANFNNTQFLAGKASFENVDFSGGKASFLGAHFSSKETEFSNAHFSGGTADFRDSKFTSGDAVFINTYFSGGDANFQNVQFCGAAVFNGAHFSGGTANFIQANFLGKKATFFVAQFSGGDAVFLGARFSGTFRFCNAVFQGIAAFNMIEIDEAISGGALIVDTSDIQWRGAFSGARFERGIRWEGSPFYAISAFDAAKYVDEVRYPRLAEGKARREFIHKAFLPARRARAATRSFPVWVKSRHKADREERREALETLEGGARMLKRAMNAQHDPHREQLFFRFELMARRAQDGVSPLEVWASRLYALTSNYGESIGRPFMALGALTVIASLFFAHIGSQTTAMVSMYGPSFWDHLPGAFGLAIRNLAQPFSIFSSVTLAESDWVRNLHDATSTYSTGPDAQITADIAGMKLLLSRLGAVFWGWNGIAMLSMVQSFFSIIFLFLLALGVRRKFQIS